MGRSVDPETYATSDANRTIRKERASGQNYAAVIMAILFAFGIRVDILQYSYSVTLQTDKSIWMGNGGKYKFFSLELIFK